MTLKEFITALQEIVTNGISEDTEIESFSGGPFTTDITILSKSRDTISIVGIRNLSKQSKIKDVG